MRKYLTTALWYQDRLSSLSSVWLGGITLICLATLATVALGVRQFLDDLSFLLDENDFGAVAICLGFLLLGTAAVWVLSCCMGALGRRLVLYTKGL